MPISACAGGEDDALIHQEFVDRVNSLCRELEKARLSASPVT
jgi:hypothetical protein